MFDSHTGNSPIIGIRHSYKMAQGIIIQIHHVSSAIGVQQIQNWTNIHFSKILLKKYVLQAHPPKSRFNEQALSDHFCSLNCVIH